MVELTENQKHIIIENAHAFWADLKVGILRELSAPDMPYSTKGRVFLYVDTWNGAQYFTDLGYSEQVDDLCQAVLNFDSYKLRSKVSASGMIRSEIQKIPKFEGRR